MDDYTPTTEDVRLIWIVSQTGRKARAEFDRWLAAHDAEVHEQAAQEIEAAAFRYAGDFEGGLFYAAEIVRGV